MISMVKVIQLSCLDQDECHINLEYKESSSNPTAIIYCFTRGIVRKHYDKSFHHLPRRDAIALLEFLCPDDSTYQVLECQYLVGTHIE